MVLEKGTSCYICGTIENITLHHLRDIHSKHNKKGKGRVLGIIYLCRKCHNIVEDIVNKGKSKSRWFNEGYVEGIKQSSRDLLHKDNHIIGCMLEGFESVLRFRGFEQEGDMLMVVASRIK